MKKASAIIATSMSLLGAGCVQPAHTMGSGSHISGSSCPEMESIYRLHDGQKIVVSVNDFSSYRGVNADETTIALVGSDIEIVGTGDDALLTANSVRSDLKGSFTLRLSDVVQQVTLTEQGQIVEVAAQLADSGSIAIVGLTWVCETNTTK